MGTKLAPTYATLVMAYLELRLYEKIEKKFGQEFRKDFEEQWSRYLDDCFINSDTTFAEVTDLHNTFNSLQRGIEFTMETNLNKNTFLQILLLVKGTRITTDIFYMPTDTFQYLPFTSCHPVHTKKNVPFNLARRICTIVEEQDTTKERLEDLKKKLTHQNYAQQITTYGIEKAQSIPKEGLCKAKAKDNNNRKNVLAFASTHNPNNSNLFPIIKSTLPLLCASERMKTSIKNTKLMNKKRAPSNLKKMLTRARFVLHEKEGPQITKCSNSLCGTCAHLQDGVSEIKLNKAKITFKIKERMTYETKDVIYFVTCNGCGKQYIGETQSLRERVTLHNEQIKRPQYRHLYVSKHISRCPYARRIKYKICPIFKLKGQNRTFRQVKRQYFIQKYKPEVNSNTT